MQVTSSFRAPCASAPTEQETLVNLPCSEYPDLTDLVVVFQEPRRMGVCSIYPIGFKNDIRSTRIFQFRIVSPSIIVGSRDSQYTKNPFERVNIMPNMMCEDRGNVQYENFVTCIDGLVEKVKNAAMEAQINADFTKWYSPVKYTDGRIHGVVAKVRNPAIRSFFEKCRHSVQLNLELKFMYASEKHCGITFEVVDAMLDGTITNNAK